MHDTLSPKTEPAPEMGEIVELQAKLPDKDDHEFVVDMARYAEGITDEKALRKKYRMFDDTVWAALGEDDELVRAIEDEKIRRIRNGSHKREKAQLLVVKAPDVVAEIMNNPEANARHRLDAAAGLDKLAANPLADTPAASSDRFQITINLGGDVVEHYDKSIAIDVNDAGGNGVSNTNNIDPQPDGTGLGARGKLLAGFPTNKWDGDGSSQLDLFAEKPQTSKRPDVHEIVRLVKDLPATERAALQSRMKMGE